MDRKVSVRDGEAVGGEVRGCRSSRRTRGSGGWWRLGSVARTSGGVGQAYAVALTRRARGRSGCRSGGRRGRMRSVSTSWRSCGSSGGWSGGSTEEPDLAVLTERECRERQGLGLGRYSVEVFRRGHEPRRAAVARRRRRGSRAQGRPMRSSSRRRRRSGCARSSTPTPRSDVRGRLLPRDLARRRTCSSRDRACRRGRRPVARAWAWRPGGEPARTCSGPSPRRSASRARPRRPTGGPERRRPGAPLRRRGVSRHRALRRSSDGRVREGGGPSAGAVSGSRPSSTCTTSACPNRSSSTSS